MHTTWANDPVNSPNHYTRSHPGMECIELTADTSFCLGNAIKYLWRYHSKGRPVEDLEKARWYLCHVIDHDEKIAWTRQQHAILDTLANDPAIPDELDLLALALWEANGERPTVYESGKAVADDVLEWWKQVAASAWGFINGTEAMQ